jgi:hypothetical protein
VTSTLRGAIAARESQTGGSAPTAITEASAGGVKRAPSELESYQSMNARRLLVAYGLLNAVLYSVLLPLWEGFDEPFHFGYVQQLANGQGLPDPRRARLSSEVGTSILLAPASQVVKQNLPQVISYAEYFSLPAPKRIELRRQLDEIRVELRWRPSQFMNYEAHHPPLAYALLALPERLLARVQLPVRVAILRIVVALVGSLLLLSGAEQLFLEIGIRDSYRAAALFCLFSCQMTWATLAHIGNDWLAVPIAVWNLVALNRYNANPSLRTAALTAVLLAVGLLTKAYFLAIVPVLVGLCVWRRRWQEFAVASVILCALAGPWYVRNLVEYGVLTGTQEARAGVDWHAVLNAAPAVKWLDLIPSSVRRTLWTGNNSFVTFSVNTLNLLIVTVLMALLLWAASRHTSTEWITFVYCASFVLAIAYAATVSHAYTHGASTGPSPWYAQVLSAPLLGLALLGASRWQRLGSVVAAFLVVLFGYILAATYAVKLIPLYGGYEGRTSLGVVTMLYTHRLKVLTANLNQVTLARAAVVYMSAGSTILLAVIQPVVLIHSISVRRKSTPSSSDQRYNNSGRVKRKRSLQRCNHAEG